MIKSKYGNINRGAFYKDPGRYSKFSINRNFIFGCSSDDIGIRLVEEIGD